MSIELPRHEELVSESKIQEIQDMVYDILTEHYGKEVVGVGDSHSWLSKAEVRGYTAIICSEPEPKRSITNGLWEYYPVFDLYVVETSPYDKTDQFDYLIQGEKGLITFVDSARRVETDLDIERFEKLYRSLKDTYADTIFDWTQ